MLFNSINLGCSIPAACSSLIYADLKLTSLTTFCDALVFPNLLHVATYPYTVLMVQDLESQVIQQRDQF